MTPNTMFTVDACFISYKKWVQRQKWPFKTRWPFEPEWDQETNDKRGERTDDRVNGRTNGSSSRLPRREEQVLLSSAQHSTAQRRPSSPVYSPVSLFLCSCTKPLRSSHINRRSCVVCLRPVHNHITISETYYTTLPRTYSALGPSQ